MSDGKLGVLADILKTVSSLCMRNTTVAYNNNAPPNKNKSLKIQRKLKVKKVVYIYTYCTKYDTS